MITTAIIGVMIAAAVPATRSWRQASAVRGAAHTVANAFTLARGQAIRSGHNHVVFFSSGAGIDPAPAGLDSASNGLVDSANDPVPILILDDGVPNATNQDCNVDTGEETTTFPAESGVSWGRTRATVTSTAPEDPGATIPANGLTFVDPSGTPVTWVLFRPDGLPVAIDSACNEGRTGSGGGTVYLSNSERDFAVTLSPLGGVRLHTWRPGAGVWTQ